MQQVFAADLSLFVQSNMAANGFFMLFHIDEAPRTTRLQINKLAKLNRCDYLEPKKNPEKDLIASYIWPSLVLPATG